MTQLLLPRRDRTLVAYTPRRSAPFAQPPGPPRSRIAFAAAHVVADPLADASPTLEAHIDWEATLDYRRYLWGLGFGVAEAMDTAQRGMGLDWATTQELIRRSLAEAHSQGARIACGAGTDQLSQATGNRQQAAAGSPAVQRAATRTGEPRGDLDAIIEAYQEQCAFIESQGGRVILMASRALAAAARGPDDYLRVYGEVLGGLQRPAILHWLGEMFDPQLAGYWGSREVALAMQTCLQLIGDFRQKIDGIKISLLSADHEITMRRQLPSGVRMYSGDDFNYVDLIQGDAKGHSDALLGIFDCIAPAAAAALHALDTGDTAQYRALLEPTVPLSRHIFQAPTYFYKTGVVFLAYLNGHQRHFRMVGGQESARSLVHLAELFVLADQAGLLRDPDEASARMRRFLALAGIA